MKPRDATTPPKAETGSFENPNDQAVLADMQARQKAGEDVFGDNDEPGDGTAPAPVPAPPAPVPGNEEIDTDGTTGEAPAPAPEPSQAAAAPIPAPTPVPTPVPPTVPVLQFKTRPAAEIQTEQTSLLNEKAAGFKAYSEGTMSPEDFAALDAKVTQGLMRIASEQALVNASAQTALQSSETALDGIKKLAKEQGHVDYDADPSAAAQFDAMAEALGKDPKIAALPDAEFFQKVHSTVLAVRGVAIDATPAPAPTPAMPREDLKPGIVTLRGIPAAATPNAGGGLTEQLSRLNGLDFQEAVGNLPKAQRDAWLDS